MKNLIEDIKKFNIILNRQQKLRIIIIGIMMVIGAGMELLGVSLIIPLISAIMDPEILETNEYAVMIREFLNIESSQQLIVVIIVGMMIVYAVKNAYLFLQCYVQNRFVCNNRFATQKRLMDVYLHRPYEFYLETNMADINRAISVDVTNVFGLLTTILSFFTELVVSSMLILMIIVVDPMMAGMVCVVLAILMVFIGIFVKPVLRRAGNKFRLSMALSNKWFNQSIQGIKDVKVAGKEDFFLEQYTRYGKDMIDSEKKNLVLSNVPRLLIEAACIDGMLAVILFMMFGGRDIATMIPQLSAFAMAAIRLLPSANRMTTYLNAIPYQEAGIDQLMENLFALEGWEKENNTVVSETEQEEITLTKSCGLRDIVYSYKNADRNVLEHADMEIPAGTSVGIVGASGAGKTTAVDILLGLLKPQEGSVVSDGKDVGKSQKQWLTHLSYVPQTIYLLDDTVRANVAFGIDEELVSDEDVWNALEEAMLADYIRSLPDGLDTRVGERGVRFSGGQRQRIGIARALYTNPELLIFDEATSALDNETEADIMASINNLHGKKTLVIIAHRLGTIESCDIVYRVENGKIIRER